MIGTFFISPSPPEFDKLRFIICHEIGVKRENSACEKCGFTSRRVVRGEVIIAANICLPAPVVVVVYVIMRKISPH